MSLILDGTNGLSDIDGSAATPAIRGTDANTGIFFPAADTIAFSEGGVEAVRINSSGNVGIGTSSPTNKLSVNGSIDIGTALDINPTGGNPNILMRDSNTFRGYIESNSSCMLFGTGPSATERMRIDSSGNLLVGKTAINIAVAGFQVEASGTSGITRDGGICLLINRNTDDGTLISFRQANTEEGSISVSGTTVSYNGGHLSRWAQTTAPKDDTLVKGTVLSNLDEMNVYTDADGNPVDNEQLNKVKVSDVEGDANVAGVFVNWSHDDDHDVDEINMAMTGDMIIRIAQGTTVARGDLLMSAGDGTAKPQGDDIVRSKTVAKVTSTHVTCTYADGSYCVPCVLMAC